MLNGFALRRRAVKLWGNSESAHRWLKALNYLRTETRGGWVFDQVAAATLREQARTVERAQALAIAPRFANRIVTPIKRKK